MERPIDTLTKATQSMVNSMITIACSGENWRRHRKIAEDIVAREIADEWDYLLIETFGVAQPEVFLTHYKG